MWATLSCPPVEPVKQALSLNSFLGASDTFSSMCRGLAVLRLLCCHCVDHCSSECRQAVAPIAACSWCWGGLAGLDRHTLPPCPYPTSPRGGWVLHGLPCHRSLSSCPGSHMPGQWGVSRGNSSLLWGQTPKEINGSGMIEVIRGKNKAEKDARGNGLLLSSQHFDRPRWEDHLRPGVWDQPGQHSKTSFLQKIKNLARHGGVSL